MHFIICVCFVVSLQWENNTVKLTYAPCLQKALKEKEEHIEQLLRERDLERSEVARAAAHVDEVWRLLFLVYADRYICD